MEATEHGYLRLEAFAEEHAGLRAWAIEGTGGHGAGLARHLARHDQLVVELDRPERAHRRNGAKSDDTRRRRIDKSISLFLDNKPR